MTKTRTKSAGAPSGKRVSILKAVSFANATGLLSRLVRWIMARQKQRNASRMLQLEETVSLGAKRFVAVVTAGGQRYLVGGGADDVVLLASLGPVQAEPAIANEESPAQAEEQAAVAVESTPFREVLERAALLPAPAEEPTAVTVAEKSFWEVLERIPDPIQAEEPAEAQVVSTPAPAPAELADAIEPVVPFREVLERTTAAAVNAKADKAKTVKPKIQTAKAKKSKADTAEASKKPKASLQPAKSRVLQVKAVPAAREMKRPEAAKEPSASHAVLHRPAAAKAVKKAKPSARGGGKSKR